MQIRRTILLAGAAIALIAGPTLAAPWYEHYANAEQALENQDWTSAVQQINAALELKGDSGARVRSYGMNVIGYFPYLRLGVAYYQLGQFDAALQAFETEERLGAIAGSESANAELLRFRALAENARTAQVQAEQQRIREIVNDSLEQAAQLEARGAIAEAMAVVDRALAVAPEDESSLALMKDLRQRFAELERAQDLDRRVSELVQQAQAMLAGENYEEASSTLGEALFLRQDPEIQSLYDTVQSRLQTGTPQAAVDEADRLEQRRLLQLSYERQQAIDRQASVDRLLASASSHFDAGATEASLGDANRVLALDPGNPQALEQIARAYAVINRQLLGARPAGNIPPAVRFVDLRREDEEGFPVQTLRTADFRLNGVIIDDSPVDVTVFANDAAIEPTLNRQPLGDFYLTEFSVESMLSPGASTFRLEARDAEGLSSGSEYAVIYVPPFYRRLWFQVLVLVAIVGAIAVPMALENRRRATLRRRKFNPYVAGAPVLDDEMFFGREALVNRILQTIHNNSLLLYGERRIGKTSIQHQLKRRLLEISDPRYAFYPVYVDLQGTPQDQFFRTIIEDIAEELAPVLDGVTIAPSRPEKYDYRDLVSDLRTVLRALQGKSTKTVKLVLLIDEVDALNEYDPRINQRLRSLFMKNFADNLVAVVSGVEIKKRWEREGSPWYNFFEEIEVTPFNPQDARDLIRKPVDGIFSMDAGVVERIISLTGGRPYLIQKICVALVTRLHEQNRRKITIADVDAVAV